MQFGRGHQEEHFCEIDLNLDQWFRMRCLKTFLIQSAGVILLGYFDLELVFQEEGSFKDISYLQLW